ncbi:hypothetical protein FIBSPDRAFT_939130 [Athelia psychrophila]|uniref:Uncharacterized protein n=1 Tax=Athelia psychrophila TaxID=1759441 RepID=A0A165X3L6_9AGAM|nr:hypothetical protein FIBSPDRAFT_939130 [Fibularhizoctonia sp. CBS 109695]
MANASIATQARPEITFYLLGERITNIVASMQVVGWTLLDQNVKDLIPTTYEASKAYLDEERLKPDGQRDLHREMCMIFVLGIPDEQDLLLVIESTNNDNTLKVSLPLKPQSTIFLPTSEIPPAIFGTREDPYSRVLFDQRASGPSKGHSNQLTSFELSHIEPNVDELAENDPSLPKTVHHGRASILLSYFTRSGSEMEGVEGEHGND